MEQEKIAALEAEMEKLRKLLSHFINGHRSEKKILSGPNQACFRSRTARNCKPLVRRPRPKRQRSSKPTRSNAW